MSELSKQTKDTLTIAARSSAALVLATTACAGTIALSRQIGQNAEAQRLLGYETDFVAGNLVDKILDGRVSYREAIGQAMDMIMHTTEEHPVRIKLVGSTNTWDVTFTPTERDAALDGGTSEKSKAVREALHVLIAQNETLSVIEVSRLGTPIIIQPGTEVQKHMARGHVIDEPVHCFPIEVIQIDPGWDSTFSITVREGYHCITETAVNAGVVPFLLPFAYEYPDHVYMLARTTGGQFSKATGRLPNRRHIVLPYAHAIEVFRFGISSGEIPVEVYQKHIEALLRGYFINQA